jgi:CelD/BcsL family acetyltransferase involved in cellulose biosynthesis
MGDLTAILDLDQLADIEPEWRRLAEGRGNAFVTPEWVRCWFDHYGAGFQPFICVLERAGGGINGLLPLAIAVSGRPRVVRLAGANLGDRFHPVCEATDEAAVGTAAGEALGDAAVPWSTIVLDHVDQAQPWVSALRGGTGRRLAAFERVAAGLPFIDLSRFADWDAFLADRSSNFRQQIRRFERNAGRDHELRYRCTETASELERDIPLFFELHDRRLQGRGGSSLESERARAFHADFASAALKRDWLRLWFLELDDQPIAAWYGWRLGDSYAYYNAGFDPEHTKLRPGLVLMAAVIRSALDEGAREFDFLLGDEAYKHRFADQSRTVSDVTLARSGHPAAFMAAAEHGARRLARRAPASVREKLSARNVGRRSPFGGRGR